MSIPILLGPDIQLNDERSTPRLRLLADLYVYLQLVWSLEHEVSMLGEHLAV